MAVGSREKTDQSRPSGRTTRRGKGPNPASPTPQEIAAEAAAIYPDTSDAPPTPDEIAAEAYRIYTDRGSTDGRDFDDWVEAERRLAEQRSKRSPSTEGA